MSNKYEEGIAFILEGDTEKEFYLSFLEFLCKKRGGILERQLDCGNNPDIIYSLRTHNHSLLIKFNTVNTVTQMPHSSRWFITQCKDKYKDVSSWNVFLCYDLDNYKNDITKFYEGDWANLRTSLKKKAKAVYDIAAAADIEDIILSDIDGVSQFLGSSSTMVIPTGSKGKAKLKKLFRQVGKTYHEGKRARALINSLDMQKIIDASSAPLTVIEDVLFELEFSSTKS